jgi:hypothetical protein
VPGKEDTMKSNEHPFHIHRWPLSDRGSKRKDNAFARLLFPFMGLVCLIWFLVRVIPKPSRAEYPCMKVAAPMAGGFVAYLAGLLAAVFSFKKARLLFRESRYLLASILLIAGVAAGVFALFNSHTDSYASTARSSNSPVFVPIDSPNTPMGTARGIFPGRVVWMWDSSATSWNGTSGNWWSDANTNQRVVDSMLARSLRALTGKPSEAAAWDTLFRYFNNNHGKGDIGYRAGEKIAIKINLNLISSTGNPGNNSFPSPHVVLALIRQLVNKAGAAAADITIYDSNRCVPDAIYTRCHTEFPGLHYMGWQQLTGRDKYVRDTTTVHWSQELTMEIGGGNPAHLPTVVTQAAYLINLASFKGHRYGGVTFCAKNHFGTMSCDTNGTPYPYAPHAAGVHPYIAVHDIIIPGSLEWTFYGRPMGTYNALVDLMGHRDLGEKSLLFMIDGLYGVQSEQDAVSLKSKWRSAPFNNDWTSSIFLSQDDVALESVGLDFFRAEATINPNDTTVYGAVDNYLHEASQADNPPSGTFYSPNGDGVRLQSLGVHEHWNNATDKQYSRNLGTGAGIELVGLQSSTVSVAAVRIPAAFSLNQNYPNPFNPSTTITYELSARSRVVLEVYDVLGRKAATLADEEQPAGKHAVQFNAKGLSSGVYFYRINVRQAFRGGDGMFTESRKFVLLK